MRIHALTSFCLPDPLTSKTGTEQALTTLSSASLRSFKRLADEDIKLLNHIANLSPIRSFYPRNEQVMQEVRWLSGLGFLAQHSKFVEMARSIANQAQRSSIFYLDARFDLPEFPSSDPDLARRESLRTAMFRISGFGAEDFTIASDAQYKSRDRGQNSSKFSNSYTMFNFIRSNKQDLNRKISPNIAGMLWHAIPDNSVLAGTSKL